MKPSDLPLSTRIGHYLLNFVLGGSLKLALAMPYETRVRFIGWLVSRVVAPLAGWRKRIRTNLAKVWPELPEAEVRRLERAVPDNAGRTLIEIYSGAEFRARQTDDVLEGPGLETLDQEVAKGRPVILVSGHFGNYDAFRAAGGRRYGHSIGAIYRPLNNIYFNRHYEKAMRDNGELFARDRRGLAQMVKFLRQGNIVAMLIDQHFSHGAELSFFGETAYTALSAAEMALKYDALIAPVWCIRQPDGLTFRVIVDEPIAHTNAEEMTQKFNDALERTTRAHPEQWLWVHRRWKPRG